MSPSCAGRSARRCRPRTTDGDLDLGRRYRTIFLAGPTFNLFVDEDTAARALGRMRAHLSDGAAALVPLYIPEVVADGELGRVREAVEPDGSIIRFSITSATRSEANRRQETMTRYERVGAAPMSLERPWVVHWHTQESFRELAASAGLSTVAVLAADGAAADETATGFAFWLTVAD